MKKVFFFLLAAFSSVSAASAGSVYFEGRIVGQDGTVQSNVSLPASFSLYDAASGGKVLRSGFGPSMIQTDSAGYVAFAMDVTMDAAWSNVYLQATASGTTILPRMRVTPAPMAMGAKYASTISSSGEYTVEGSAVIGTLNAGKVKVIGKSTMEGGATFTGTLDGFNSLYCNNLDLSYGKAVSLLKANGETGYSYDAGSSDYSLYCENDGSDSKIITAAGDGFMTIWTKAWLTRDTDGYYAKITIKVGDTFIADGRYIHNTHNSDDTFSNRIFTFPVRANETVCVFLRTDRTTIFYNPEAWAKIKVYYFGRK